MLCLCFFVSATRAPTRVVLAIELEFVVAQWNIGIAQAVFATVDLFHVRRPLFPRGSATFLSALQALVGRFLALSGLDSLVIATELSQ